MYLHEGKMSLGAALITTDLQLLLQKILISSTDKIDKTVRTYRKLWFEDLRTYLFSSKPQLGSLSCKFFKAARLAWAARAARTFSNKVVDWPAILLESMILTTPILASVRFGQDANLCANTAVSCMVGKINLKCLNDNPKYLSANQGIGMSP